MKRNIKSLGLVLIGLAFIAADFGCTRSQTPASDSAGANSSQDSGGADSKGVGPITQEVKLAAIDAGLVAKGKSTFEAKCTACHKIESRYVGPALQGVTKRRQPEWIMNMILNPVEMTQKDATAKGLLGEYLTQMTFQNVSQDEARWIVEYFRSNDK